MKAIEFQTRLHDPGFIEIPLLLQNQLKADQDLSIIVLIDDDTKDDAWKKPATRQFFAGYSDEDAIYD